MTTGPRSAGEFCWINMLTPQPEQARDFFSTDCTDLTDAYGCTVPGSPPCTRMSSHCAARLV